LNNFNTIYNCDNLKGNFFFNSELELRATLINFLNEDIGTGDITSNLLIPKEIESTGTIICKSKDKTLSIVGSGLAEAKLVFEICGCEATQLIEDGSIISEGTEVMSVKGAARSILKAERTALNIIMRMSGISTKTRQFVEKLDDLSKVVRIASTRKTAP
jgi:nicotinate-nucleotide pyrophosphorylase (carboxylating)